MRSVIRPPLDFTVSVPSPGEPGSFGERRDAGVVHNGVDLDAPVGSPVRAILPGRVISASWFTASKLQAYWNDTYVVAVRSLLPEAKIILYAELGRVDVKVDQWVEAGQVVGWVGAAINDQWHGDMPTHIRQRIQTGRLSMLHLEVYEPVDPRAVLERGGEKFVP